MTSDPDATSDPDPISDSDVLTEPMGRERVWVAISLVMASACVAQAFGRFTWGLVLPGARDDLLDGSNTLAGFFGTLNVTAYLIGTLAVSWAASRLNLVNLMRVGLVVSTTALGVASIAPSGPVLGAALFAMGFGGAIIWIPAPAIAARALPPERTGMAVGLIGSGIGIGILFSGQLTTFLGRRSETGDANASDVDAVWKQVYRIEFFVAIIVLVAAFAFLRSRGDRPGASGGFGGIGALRAIRGWVPLTVAYASFGFAYILVIAFLVARLEDDAGFTTDQAAAMFSIVGIASVIGGMVLGPLSDRIGRPVTLTGAFVAFAGCTLLFLSGSQPWVALAAFGIGSMFSGMPSLVVAHVVDHTTPATYGPAFSAATLAFGVTQMISPQIGGAIADLTGSFTVVFALSASISLLGALASSRLPH